MTKTLQVALSDAVIKKHAEDPAIRELKDPRHPLRFRYRHDRTRGSWYVVTFNRGAQWRKAGNWPDIPARLMLESLPRVLQRIAEERNAAATVDGWQLVAQVLEWYAARVESDRALSEERRATVLSAIRRHLLPRLGSLPLRELTKAALDDRFYMPLQAEFSAAHIKGVFGVLKRAFKQAMRQGRVTADPLSAVTFADFSQARIKPKAARLRHVAVAELLSAWAELFDRSPLDVTFAALMLAHGTRISETRKARWHHVDLIAGEWFIPAPDTKAKRDHVLPLTPQAVALLKRYRAWQQGRGYAGAFLFPAPTRSGKPLARSAAFDIFARLGGGEWTSHDLRKLAATRWAEQGTDSTVVELLLNHALPELKATYVQTNAPALKRAALERWHGWLDERGFSLLHDSTALRRAGKPTEAEAADWLICQPE